MQNQNIVLIDYGMGNMWSVASALRYLGVSPVISSDPNIISRADSLILPGVGSFRNAMMTLHQSGIDHAIYEAVQIKGRKILGICLGMQLMGISSTEDGFTAGLQLIKTEVDVFSIEEIREKKLPHIGFNSVSSHRGGNLFKNLPEISDFYFVHSYRMLHNHLTGNTATCSYGIDFLAAYEQENIFATQFHPEKSQANGLILLKNFLGI